MKKTVRVHPSSFILPREEDTGLWRTMGTAVSRGRAMVAGCPLLPCEVGMHESPRARLVAYGVAVLAPALSLLVRWPLWPVLGDAVPHMTFFPAVMIAAYFGGFWPGLLATFLSAAAANFFLTGQLRSFHISSANDIAALIIFTLVGTFISAL